MCMLDCLLVLAVIFYMYKANIWMRVVTSLQQLVLAWWWCKHSICVMFAILSKLLELNCSLTYTLFLILRLDNFVSVTLSTASSCMITSKSTSLWLYITATCIYYLFFSGAKCVRYYSMYSTCRYINLCQLNTVSELGCARAGKSSF